jgi:hypothetical protein
VVFSHGKVRRGSWQDDGQRTIGMTIGLVNDIGLAFDDIGLALKGGAPWPGQGTGRAENRLRPRCGDLLPRAALIW